MPVTPTFSFVGYWVWSKGMTLINYFLLITSSLGCTQAICVFIGVSPLHLYFISLFFRYNNFLSKHHHLLTYFVDNAFQHLWVHNVNKEVFINSKKILANGWTMVRLQQCSLNFYSYKLHNLYYYCHITKLPTTILSTSKLLPSIFDVVNKRN
jgi:hypothetical protein